MYLYYVSSLFRLVAMACMVWMKALIDRLYEKGPYQNTETCTLYPLYFEWFCIFLESHWKFMSKGTWTRFHVKFSNFVFPFSMCILINIEVYNTMSKFETRISSYKQDTEFIILCFVNKARMLSFFIFVLYWGKFQSNVTFFCWW